jgi:hypothetical protein
VPYIFWNFGIQILQQPEKITIVYFYDHEIRHVRMNQPHPAHVTPSWYGDSVGHYEGDTLVIDTVGIKTNRPFAMVDTYGTPYTLALHVVERYRLLDYEAAKEGFERDARENFRVATPDDGPEVDRDYMGKALQLQFTVEDEGVFTMPWSATVTYRRAQNESLEVVCAENTHEYYAGKGLCGPACGQAGFLNRNLTAPQRPISATRIRRSLGRVRVTSLASGMGLGCAKTSWRRIDALPLWRWEFGAGRFYGRADVTSVVTTPASPP